MNIEIIKNSKAQYIGKIIEYFEEIDSTHIQAKKKVNDLNNGTILLAEVQNAGIGTKGRTWHTGNSKNIAMTIIIKPNCKVSDLNGLTIKIACCLQSTFKELYGITSDIKYPNDIMINSKKVCGILTESNSTGDNVNYIIISLGINVNEENFSNEIRNIATSLKIEFKKDFSREEIIKKFIEKLEKIIVF